MRNVLLLLFFSGVINNIEAQGFGFSCTKDTAVSCSLNCFTLTANIPDIHSTTSAYTITPLSTTSGCFTPYVSPELPGMPTNLTQDDKYSSVIDIGFPFPFFGTNYTQLVISTNGYLSFDISLANSASHYAILTNGTSLTATSGTPLDLPSSLYDKALIMGPYHDIDLTKPTSPTKLLKYDVVGTAPHRRWIVSYNKIPLYSSPGSLCQNLFLNTSQIVLYEGSGLIEVFIADQQICPSWNEGRAMIGIMDFSRTQAYMAPGRQASDPPWGTPVMNESWRFVPSAGPSLFKRVELRDLAGNLLRRGDTLGIGSGILRATFDSVCNLPPGSTKVIVKSYYKNFNDASIEEIGIDTINVSRTAGIMTAIASNASCITGLGTITVREPVGPSFEYNIDGGPWQSSNIFLNQLPGMHHLTSRQIGFPCLSTTDVTISTLNPITASFTILDPPCMGSTGTITIIPSGGTTPYRYALNAGAYQASNLFTNLPAGNYQLHVKDATNCIFDTSFILNQPALFTVSANADSASCNGNDGHILITGAGGTSPFQYSINGGVTYQPSNSFTDSIGTHNVRIKDAHGCIADTIATIYLSDRMRLSLIPDTTDCMGSQLVLLPSTNPETNRFTWSPAGGSLNSTTGAYTVSPSDTTTYFLTARWGVCQRSASVKVNVLHKPIADAGRDTIICFNTPAFLEGSASNVSGPVNYLWSPANELSRADSSNIIAMPRSPGPHTYTLEVSDAYGCNFKVTDNVVVTMNSPVAAFAGRDTIAALGLPHQLFGSGGVTYLWSPAQPLNDPTAKNPIATLFNDTRFFLTVTDNGGCLGYDTVFVKVYSGPTYYIPNAFTPNGDGINDYFRAIPPGIAKTNYFKIFNRWGQLVFETHDYLKGWDGTYIGKPQPNGAYVWIIQGIDKFGKIIEMKGTVMLIR